MKLTQKKLINLIFSVDGKEYITPKQLEHEIEDELLHNNGRILMSVKKLLKLLQIT